MIRRIPNCTKVRWSNNRDSKTPYVVEMRKNRCEHCVAGGFVRETYSASVVGRYATESAANKAAIKAARKRGGFAYDLRVRLIAVYGCASRQCQFYLDETEPQAQEANN